MERLLTSADIASMLSVSLDQARLLMDKMPHINIGIGTQRRALRVLESEFRRWVDSRKRVPAEPRKRGRKRTA